MDTNRIEKINALGNKIAQKEQNKINQKKSRLEALIEEITALVPRIQNLCQLAQAMLDNKIPLGKQVNQMIGYRFEFETDHIDHKLGFYIDGNKLSRTYSGHIVGFGIGGGGCCGHDLQIDLDGNIVSGLGTCSPYLTTEPEIGKMTTLVKEFDSFETRFLGYIDSVTE